MKWLSALAVLASAGCGIDGEVICIKITNVDLEAGTAQIKPYDCEKPPEQRRLVLVGGKRYYME